MIVISGGLWLLVVIPVEIQRARSKRHVSVTVQEGEDGIPLVALKGTQEWVRASRFTSTGPSPGPAPGARSQSVQMAPPHGGAFYALGRVGGPIAGKSVSRDVFSCHRIQKGEYLCSTPTCGVDFYSSDRGYAAFQGLSGRCYARSWMRTSMRRHFLSRPTLRCLRAGEVDFGSAPEDRGWLKVDCP